MPYLYKFPIREVLLQAPLTDTIRKGETAEIYGYLSGRTGFAFLWLDGTITVKKDLDVVKFSENRKAFDIAVIKDTCHAAFDNILSLWATFRQRDSADTPHGIIITSA